MWSLREQTDRETSSHLVSELYYAMQLFTIEGKTLLSRLQHKGIKNLAIGKWDYISI